MNTRTDKVAIGVIWLVVVVGAFLVGVNSSDPGGVGELAAGIGVALTVAYRYVRRLPTSDRFIRVDEKDIGKATATWLTAVLAIALWVTGSVLLILARVPDGYAVVLGWLLPITVYLVYRPRGSRHRT
jgi:hypothetical protein